MKLNTLIAGCMGLIGFAVSLLAGVQANNPLGVILSHALLASLGCCVIGYIAGMMANSVAGEHATRLAADVAKKDAEAKAKRQAEDAERAARMAATS
jgi:hypothetical protein